MIPTPRNLRDVGIIWGWKLLPILSSWQRHEHWAFSPFNQSQSPHPTPYLLQYLIPNDDIHDEKV